ncbi:MULTISPECIES: alpha/beta fold hydrolase [Bradyrhizobium]|uniref:alpha/beta fold hydrolase n=1 Tax=Bradyrhizobium TaxID=374 RepID=UPI0021616FA7|nr:MULTISPECIES: alpha/beta fold hydrolase [Bradyrhizobium]
MNKAGPVAAARRTHLLRAQGPSCFYAGTEAHPIYVDHVRPAAGGAEKTPVVMVHGAAHTGTCYMATPDLRPGWAPRFAGTGRHVFVPDWPGHGRSPQRADFPTLGTADVANSLLALLEEIGPAVLLVHSASGPMAWWMTERRPDLIRAVVGIAPGPPANLLKDLPDDPVAVAALRDDAGAGRPVHAAEDRPVWLNAEFAAASWTYTPRFPQDAFEHYFASIVAESPRILNERFNIGGRGLRIGDPDKLRDHRILIVTGELDPRHPREVDAATAAYLGADFVWLPDRGITGNGHMMMIEDNSDDLAALILTWLDVAGC